uniref:Uncharacterized protein n=1 Tax=Cacopsylla melanoneura TaxID=428564 RepID=A0A8D8Z378_9HEMI
MERDLFPKDRFLFLCFPLLPLYYSQSTYLNPHKQTLFFNKLRPPCNLWLVEWKLHEKYFTQLTEEQGFVGPLSFWVLSLTNLCSLICIRNSIMKKNMVRVPLKTGTQVFYLCVHSL